MISLRLGTRPASMVTRPPSVVTPSSISFSSSGGSTWPSSDGKRRARVGDDAAVGARDDLGPVGVVVLVLDLADDLLDHVLDGDEPVDAAELVDDQRHVDAR